MQRLFGQHAAYNGRGHSNHLLARVRNVLVGVEVAVVTRIAAANIEYGSLALKSAHGTIKVGYAGCAAGIVDDVACGKIVATVNDHVVLADDAGGIVARQAERVGLEADLGVEAVQAFDSFVNFGLVKLLLGIQHLAVQVAVAYYIIVHQT